MNTPSVSTLLEQVQSLIKAPITQIKETSQLHPLGPVSPLSSKRQFLEKINTIRETISEYRQATVSSDPANPAATGFAGLPAHDTQNLIKRLNKTLKDQANHNSNISRLKTVIEGCQEALKNSRSDSSMRKQDFIKQIKNICKDVKMEVYIESSGNQTSLTLSGRSILIDINLSKEGQPNDLNVSDDSINPNDGKMVADILLQNLKKMDFVCFKENLGIVASLDTWKNEKLIDFFPQIQSFTAAVIQKCEIEREGESIMQGQGILQSNSQFLTPCLLYFASPSSLIENEVVLLNDVPLSHSKQGYHFCFFSIDEIFDSETNTSEPCFSLRLQPPVLCSLSSTKKLHELLKGETLNSSNFSNKSMTSLEESLLRSEFGNQTTDITQLFSHLVTIDLSPQVYMIGATSSPSFLVEKILFTNSEQILPALNILRQQLTFNELFASCFKGGKLVDSSKLAPESCFLEICLEPPNLIQINFLHQVSGNMNCLEIEISGNGSCSVLQNSESNSMLDQVIQKTLSIPVAVRKILESKKHKRRHSLEIEPDFSSPSKKMK